MEEENVDWMKNAEWVKNHLDGMNVIIDKVLLIKGSFQKVNANVWIIGQVKFGIYL